MHPEVRASFFAETRGHKFSNYELRDSLRTIGQLEPLVTHRGHLIDGARRRYTLQCLRKSERVIEIASPTDAARYLWAHHPQRAYRMFAPEGARRHQLQTLFGCAISELPTAQELRDYEHASHRQRRNPELARLPSIQVPRAQLQAAHEAARAHGITLSAAVKGVVRYLAEERLKI